ncbi:hypothetical protein D3C87_1165440 [compost metagenome]
MAARTAMSSPKILRATWLFTPEISSSTRTAMGSPKARPMPGTWLVASCIFSTSSSLDLAVFHCSRGLSLMKMSDMLTSMGSEATSARPVRVTTISTSGNSLRMFSTALAWALAFSSETLARREAEMTIEPSSILGKNSDPKRGTRASEATRATTAPPKIHLPWPKDQSRARA